MTRFRTTYTFEYEATDDNGAYGTDDPDIMARIDCKEFADDPYSWFSLAEQYVAEYVDVTVEPIE